jgi:hypothetical protein
MVKQKNYNQMRKVVFLLSLALVVLSMTSCNRERSRLAGDVVNNPASATGEIDSDSPQIKFDFEEHDFGKITAGEKVSYTFTFKNTGKSDLIVSRVTASCGCTAPKYSTAPIAPGQSGTIDVSFNSEGRKGVQNKSVTVVTNATPNTVVLRIKATVMEL